MDSSPNVGRQPEDSRSDAVRGTGQTPLPRKRFALARDWSHHDEEMYEKFGAEESGNSKRIRFRVFVPDNVIDPTQYQRGGASNIASITVIGDFQSQLGSTDWTVDPTFRLQPGVFIDPEDQRAKGTLYELVTGAVPDGFYQYKLHVAYAGGASRVVCDPCTKYGGVSDQNSAVVVGGPDMTMTRLQNPLPLEKLVIYELMADDFTHFIGGNKAALTIIQDQLDYLQSLGVTAIELMPWTQWPGEDYNWGYEPQGYFAVTLRYVLSPNDPTQKLFLLKSLIAECHRRNIQVFMDGVFDHVTPGGAKRGFGYRHLWEDPDQSPFVGTFAESYFGADLDFANGCVEDLIFDVCRYWIEEFAIDGIRFDESTGFYDPANHGTRGLSDLMGRLRQWLGSINLPEFPLILEHKWEYSSIGVVNQVGASACWLDPFRGETRNFLTNRQIRPSIMRLLDSARDFDAGRCPVTYIENHDHESFMMNAGSREEWWRTQPYVIALLTCSGAPMIHNGQEYGERYPMPENDGQSPPSVDPAIKRVVPRPLLWSQKDDPVGGTMLDLYRRLIKLRTGHPGLSSPNFHPRGWDESNRELDADGFGIDEARQVVVYHRWGNAADGRLERFYIVLNFSLEPQSVEMSFPENDGWVDLLSWWNPPVQGNRLRFEVGSNWGHVFYKKY